MPTQWSASEPSAIAVGGLPTRNVPVVATNINNAPKTMAHTPTPTMISTLEYR